MVTYQTAQWHLPADIWLSIFREATFPDLRRRADKRQTSQTADRDGNGNGNGSDSDPEHRIARRYDPYSLALSTAKEFDDFDSTVFMSDSWRNDLGLKPPIDTATSLSTKSALVRVCRAFYDLALPFLYENLYIGHLDVEKLGVLAKVLGGPASRTNERHGQGLGLGSSGSVPPPVGHLTKVVYLGIQAYPRAPDDDAWAARLIPIIQQLSHLHGFVFQRHVERDVLFLAWGLMARKEKWNRQATALLDSVPSSLRLFEWNVRVDLTHIDDHIPLDGVNRLLRRSRELVAAVIAGRMVSLDLRRTEGSGSSTGTSDSQDVLPHLKVLSVISADHFMEWDELPSLASYTIVGFRSFFDFGSRRGTMGRLPSLRSLVIGHTLQHRDPEQMRALMLVAPNLEELAYVQRCEPEHMNMWSMVENSSLRRIRRDIGSSLVTGRQQTLSASLSILRAELRPLAEKRRFPKLVEVRIGSVAEIPAERGESRDGLSEAVYESASALVAAGIRVAVDGIEVSWS